MLGQHGKTARLRGKLTDDDLKVIYQEIYGQLQKHYGSKDEAKKKLMICSNNTLGCSDLAQECRGLNHTNKALKKLNYILIFRPYG